MMAAPETKPRIRMWNSAKGSSTAAEATDEGRVVRCFRIVARNLLRNDGATRVEATEGCPP